jgi:hypothetical protein
MNQKIKEWVLGFPCSRCQFMGVEKLGTVLVLGQDEASDLQVIAFCYECARIMMSPRRKPVANKRTATPSSTNSARVIKLQREAANEPADREKSARPPA